MVHRSVIPEPVTDMPDTPQQTRDTLLKAARAAGERYVQVRGVDLEAALNETVPARQLPRASKNGTEEKDD